MKADQTAVSIVAVGNFAPSRFTLEVLEGANVLSKTDIGSATYQGLLADQLIDLKIGTWGKLTVLNETLTVQVFEAPYIRAADLILKCIREVAPTSAVMKLGINVTAKYVFPSAAERNALGVRLVPPQAWGAWGKQVAETIQGSKDGANGGMVDAVLRQTNPGDRESGHIDVRVTALNEITKNGPQLGAQIQINDHYEPKATSEGSPPIAPNVWTATILNVLEQNFDTSIARSLQICDDVVGGG